MSSVYETCSAANGEDVLLVVQCVADWMERSSNATTIDQQFVTVTELTDWLLLLTGALIFFMQAGFAMVCAGAIRKKNINNTVRRDDRRFFHPL